MAYLKLSRRHAGQEVVGQIFGGIMAESGVLLQRGLLLPGLWGFHPLNTSSVIVAKLRIYFNFHDILLI